VVSKKLGELGVGRKHLRVNFEIATKFAGGLKGVGLRIQEIFIEQGIPLIDLTREQLDARMNEGETSSGGYQKEFRVGDDCVS